MKKLLVLAVFLAGPAFAQPGGEGNNTGCQGQGNPNSPCVPRASTGGTGGAGGAGGIGGTGGIGGAAVAVGGPGGAGGSAAAAAAASTAAGYPNPWFIMGQTTNTSAPGTMNPCAISESFTVGPLGHSSSSEAAPCVGMREAMMNPGALSPWQYERMCVASKDWRTTDQRTARQCYETRQADARNTTTTVVRPVAQAPVVTPVTFDASPYRTASDCLNAAPPSARAACAGKP